MKKKAAGVAGNQSVTNDCPRSAARADSSRRLLPPPSAAGRPVPVLLTALSLSSLRVVCRTQCAVLALPAPAREFWAGGTVWLRLSIHPDCLCRILFPHLQCNVAPWLPLAPSHASFDFCYLSSQTRPKLVVYIFLFGP